MTYLIRNALSHTRHVYFLEDQQYNIRKNNGSIYFFNIQWQVLNQIPKVNTLIQFNGVTARISNLEDVTSDVVCC